MPVIALVVRAVRVSQQAVDFPPSLGNASTGTFEDVDRETLRLGLPAVLGLVPDVKPQAPPGP